MQAPNLTGQIIKEGDLIGSGGFADVWMGTWLSPDTPIFGPRKSVAIKVIRVVDKEKRKQDAILRVRHFPAYFPVARTVLTYVSEVAARDQSLPEVIT